MVDDSGRNEKNLGRNEGDASNKSSLVEESAVEQLGLCHQQSGSDNDSICTRAATEDDVDSVKSHSELDFNGNVVIGSSPMQLQRGKAVDEVTGADEKLEQQEKVVS